MSRVRPYLVLVKMPIVFSTLVQSIAFAYFYERTEKNIWVLVIFPLKKYHSLLKKEYDTELESLLS